MIRSDVFTMFDPAPEITIEKRFCAGSSTKEANALHTSAVKVLSWNIAKSNYSDSWVRDCRQIIEVHQPTLIFLQEVRLRAADVEHPENAMPELLEMGWSFAPNFVSRRDRSYSGILVAAKALSRQSHSLLSSYAEPVANTPKVSLFVTYSRFDKSKPTADSLLAVNIHAINFVGLAKFQAQLQAIETKIAQHRGPVVFAGDFNTWSQRRQKSLNQVTESLGLKAVTFDSKNTHNLKHFLLSPPLDHIFYRGLSQQPDSAQVIDTLPTSDHNPLLVELIG